MIPYLAIINVYSVRWYISIPLDPNRENRKRSNVVTHSQPETVPLGAEIAQNHQPHRQLRVRYAFVLFIVCWV